MGSKRRAINVVALTLGLSGLSGCLALAPAQSGGNSAPSAATACTDPRPKVCTMEYRPVCADLVAGGEKTYASGCNACADVAVARYVNQACEADLQTAY